MTNLKPCPFCGGEATLHPFFSGRYMAVCKKCSVNMPMRDTYEEAIEAWNTRAERACRDQLEQLCRDMYGRICYYNETNDRLQFDDRMKDLGLLEEDE